MSEEGIYINDLTKNYKNFSLRHASFCIPKGTIVGLIGENGAGKSTIINLLLSLITKDAGTIELYEDKETHPLSPDKMGVVFENDNFPAELSSDRLSHLFGHLYKDWDEAYFHTLLKTLHIPADKKVSRFSKGMTAKLSIVLAMSHHPDTLILDEPTSGLDPVVRDDILDLLLDFVQDPGHSVLLSSHITGDLEKIADYIVFLHAGEVLFEKPKDTLLYQYGILKCNTPQFARIDKADIIVYRKLACEYQILIADRARAHRKYPEYIIDPATIEDIMLLYIKGAQHEAYV